MYWSARRVEHCERQKHISWSLNGAGSTHPPFACRPYKRQKYRTSDSHSGSNVFTVRNNLLFFWVFVPNNKKGGENTMKSSGGPKWFPVENKMRNLKLKPLQEELCSVSRSAAAKLERLCLRWAGFTPARLYGLGASRVRGAFSGEFYEGATWTRFINNMLWALKTWRMLTDWSLWQVLNISHRQFVPSGIKNNNRFVTQLLEHHVSFVPVVRWTLKLDHNDTTVWTQCFPAWCQSLTMDWRECLWLPRDAVATFYRRWSSFFDAVTAVFLQSPQRDWGLVTNVLYIWITDTSSWL